MKHSLLALQTFTEAFSTSFNYDRDAAFIDGCLYDESGNAIELSFRHGGVNGDRIRDQHPKIAVSKANITLKGRSIYLGNWAGHYGHFILESLSRMWAISEFDNYVFQPFIFGRDVYEWQLDILKPFGINPAKITVLRHPVAFEHITVPEQALIINHSANCADMRSIYSKISSFYRGGLHQRKLFLSRDRVENKREGGEVEKIERLFVRHGFEIIHPQELDIKSQVETYQSAGVLAGFSGSALHNIVFCRPGTRLIDLGDSRSQSAPLPGQRLCNQISGAVAEFIPTTVTNDAVRHDTKRIEALISTEPVAPPIRSRSTFQGHSRQPNS